jgi:hypothetical protein
MIACKHGLRFHLHLLNKTKPNPGPNYGTKFNPKNLTNNLVPPSHQSGCNFLINLEEGINPIYFL